MKILLTTINSKYIHQNLAVGLLYELNKEYPGLSCREFELKTPDSEIVAHCSSYNVVAFSCYIWNISRTLTVASLIKQTNPHCKILLGGPEVSYQWDDIIASPNIDFIITGEGEIPFTAFLENYPNLNSIPALIYKNENRVLENPMPETFDLKRMQNINPYLSVPAKELKHKICYIEASRGCPNRCGFCLAGLENKVRLLPLETIQNNLLYLMQHGKTIKFLDRTFNAHPDFAIDIFRFILEHYQPGNIFQFEIKADIIQDKLITFIRQHVPKGIFRFEIGIQTLNSQSNLEVKRKQNFENIKSFIAQVADIVEVHLDLIVGLPHDYWNDIRFSFEEVFKILAPELQLGFLKFLKGTPIRNDYSKHGYRFDPLPPYQIIESNYLSINELDEISLTEHTLNIFWNNKRALHTLRYVAKHYSVFDFLLGTGKFWKNKNNLQNTGIQDIFTILNEYSRHHFPDDIVLHELIALDFFLQHKVKPGLLLIPETDKKQRQQLMAQLKLNHHKFRYIICPVHFSVQELLKHQHAEAADDLLIIEYNGTELPRIILVDKFIGNRK
jgi:anaerobic magnesium-protoporphyrin IX monomethyl ester cyclase